MLRKGVMRFPYTSIHVDSGHTLTEDQRRRIRRLVTFMEPLTTVGWLVCGSKQAPIAKDGSFHTSGKFILQAVLKKVEGGDSLTFAVKCVGDSEIRSVYKALWDGATIYTTSRRGLLREIPQAKIIQTIEL